MKLFTTAFIQVFLVSVNVYFISHVRYTGIAFVAFGISWFWAGNVKQISISGNKERFIYALGACVGAVMGVFMSNVIFSH